MSSFEYSLSSCARIRRLRAAFALALSCLAFESFGQVLQIYRLKANYLIGFLGFAKWKSEPASKAKTIAVLSDPDLYQDLRRITENRANGRELEIIQLNPETPTPFDKIDVLFVDKSQDAHWQTIRERCMEAGILLVGEESRFLQDGGVIQFVFRKDRLRFIVNQDNADRQGIILSSKLIELSADKR